MSLTKLHDLQQIEDRVWGMKAAAELALEFGNHDLDLSLKAKAAGDTILASSYADKAGRAFLISAAISAKALEISGGD